MPRPLYVTEPKVINTLQPRRARHPYLEVATTNRNKLEEFRRILPEIEIVGVKLDIEEIQSLDPYKVVERKAIEAYKANDYNPILVEETSLALRGLGGRPGAYIKDFCEEAEMRRMIAEGWLNGRDRAALAKVLIAVYDGAEVQIREGNTAGHDRGDLARRQRLRLGRYFHPGRRNTHFRRDERWRKGLPQYAAQGA